MATENAIRLQMVLLSILGKQLFIISVLWLWLVWIKWNDGMVGAPTTSVRRLWKVKFIRFAHSVLRYAQS